MSVNVEFNIFTTICYFFTIAMHCAVNELELWVLLMISKPSHKRYYNDYLPTKPQRIILQSFAKQASNNNVANQVTNDYLANKPQTTIFCKSSHKRLSYNRLQTKPQTTILKSFANQSTNNNITIICKPDYKW